MSNSYNDNEAYEADRLGSDSGKNKELSQAPISALQKRRAALEELDEAKFSVCFSALSSSPLSPIAAQRALSSIPHLPGYCLVPHTLDLCVISSIADLSDISAYDPSITFTS